MKKATIWKRWWTGLLALVLSVVLAAPVMAAKGISGPPTEGPGQGAPGGGGGGGNGGGGNGGDSGDPGDHSRGNDNPGNTKGDLYGDLWVIVRDVSDSYDGLPVFFDWNWVTAQVSGGVGILHEEEEPATGYPIDFSISLASNQGCVQPVTSHLLTNPPPDWPADLDWVQYQSDWADYIFENAPFVNSLGEAVRVYPIPLTPYPECEIPVLEWEAATTEVEFGRLNLSRTTQDVIDARYAEAVATIESAETLSLDPAGRVVVTFTDGTEKTIDSPLENLALYQRLMQYIQGDDVTFPIDVYNLRNTYEYPQNDPLMLAASFLAAAADKFGEIIIDHVAVINIVLGISSPDVYFDFDGFNYTRSTEYDGRMAWVLVYENGVYVPREVDLYDVVPFTGTSDDWPIGDQHPSDLVNFVRAADDALQVIDFIHEYEVPAPTE